MQVLIREQVVPRQYRARQPAARQTYDFGWATQVSPCSRARYCPATRLFPYPEVKTDLKFRLSPADKPHV